MGLGVKVVRQQTTGKNNPIPVPTACNTSIAAWHTNFCKSDGIFKIIMHTSKLSICITIRFVIHHSVNSIRQLTVI